MFIRSRRLFLRPPFPEDRSAIHAAIGDPSIVSRLGDAPWPYGSGESPPSGPGPRDAGHPDTAMPQFVITLPDLAEAPVIGGCGLAYKDGMVELGYWIGRRWRRRGFAGEAVCALLEIADMLDHQLVAALHFLDNPASGQVLRKAGFRPTGEIVPRMSFARGVSVPAARYIGRPRELVMHSDNAMIAA